MHYFTTRKAKNISFFFTRVALIFVILINNLICVSQESEIGFPFAENIHPKTYGFESQNFSSAQDKTGLLFFGNLSGILEYDGINWKLIPLNGIPRLAADDNGKIYVGCYNNFGYLRINLKNNNEFVSLITMLHSNNRTFGEVKKILAYKNDVLFVAGTKLFLYNQKQLKMIDSSAVEINIFKANGKIFISRQPGGIFQYRQGSLMPVNGGDYFTRKTVLALLSINNNLLIKTEEDKGFFQLMISGNTYPFETDIDGYIQENKLTSAVQLSNDYYAFGTARSGFAVINKNGKYITGLNDKTGLHNDNINDMYLDSRNNLWLCLNNGLSRTEIPSAFTYMNRNNGVNGGVSSICRFRNKFYIATTTGAYYYNSLSNNYPDKSSLSNIKFLPVKNLNTDCNKFFIFENELFVSADDGIYIIKNDIATKLSDGSLENILRSVKYPDKIYLARETGLSCMYKDKGKWVEEKMLPGLKETIRTLAEEDDGTLWLGTDYSGTFMVLLNNEWKTDAHYISFREGYGLPPNFNWLDVYKTYSGVLFSTQKGVFRFNKENNNFYPDTLLGFDFSPGNRWVFPIVEDNNKNIWLSSGVEGIFAKETALAYFNGKGNKYKLVTGPFFKIKDFTIESIFPDSNSIVWLGSFDGLIRFDPLFYRRDTSVVSVLLRQITIGHDSLVYCTPETYFNEKTGKTDTIIPVINYRYNHITFSFSTPFYDSPGEIKYRYYLEGFDDDWSEWEKINMKEYTNLLEGSYVFHVRAKNIYGNESGTTSFKFIVKPPLYRTWFAIMIYLVLLMSFIFMLLRFRAYKYAQEKFKLENLLAERTEELVKQKERAEELIANILPKDTADELASKGHATRKKYKMVTVLFSDVQGFTMIAEHMNPEKLLDELDKFFLHFDTVVERLGIEKIKTIGDAYMCAGGLPQKNRTNPIDVVVAAIEMQQFIKELRKESENEWDIRIGIHTGPVIAGVVGSKKFTYDIWGDTVNIASRMESSGKAGQINISEDTYELVKEYFNCEYRGKLPVKYKGEIDMYFVKGIKPELSLNNEGIAPNELFHKKLQFIIFDDLEEFIMTKLDKGLPRNLYYHNIKHTIDVMVQVEIFGLGEGASREEMLMLKTAALFHDTGFLIGYDDHELLSIKMAKDILPSFKYNKDQISTISELIYATKFPPNPKNKLERIICDADLDYLGRNDFIPTSQNLFRELYERGKVRSIEEWNKLQYEFIKSHQYFTQTAKNMRNVNKTSQLNELDYLV